MTPSDVQRPRVSAYISGKARVPVLQLICYTSGTLKICPNLKLTAQLAYIVTDTDYDCGRYFNVSMTFPIVLISINGYIAINMALVLKVS